MTFVLFPVGGLFDKVVDNQTNYQGDKYLFASVSNIDKHPFNEW